ncbi:hypothetical protein RRG08_035905 [Elysia crispata]|uniref:Core-binding factor subunit beta n=1 Tax=Elysia crispata TaxID=231223 RepID=A0AAE1A2K3_9GAST|nr:hypothetical protein RRG08_035905 [Elysia crispata]
MNERSPDSMLSFVADTLCYELKEKFIFAMPRVVPDQRTTFESDELFRKLSRECEVRYTGFRDRPMDERQLRFQAECREGHADVAFVCTGTTLQLNFSANSWSERPEDRVLTTDFVDFDSEPGKVHLKSQFILNGVCVLWRGYIDLVRLDGVGCLEFDRERAEVEARLLREQLEENNRRVQEFEEHRLQQIQLDHERQERRERWERRDPQASSEAEKAADGPHLFARNILPWSIENRRKWQSYEAPRSVVPFTRPQLCHQHILNRDQLIFKKDFVTLTALVCSTMERFEEFLKLLSMNSATVYLVSNAFPVVLYQVRWAWLSASSSISSYTGLLNCVRWSLKFLNPLDSCANVSTSGVRLRV